MFNKLLFFFVVIIPITLNAQHDLKSTEQFVQELEKRIPQLLQDFSVPGAAIAIIENGDVVLQKGYGLADVKNREKVTIKTGFNIASISKTVAAWGVMKLVQDGKIDLDAAAEKYLSRWQLPESEFNSDEVTIRRLLSHTAGLSLHGYPGWSPSDTLPTIEQSLNGKNNGPGPVEIILKPGTQYKYSGGGYTILQLVIEEVTGQSFEDFMQQEILDPLGMTNSSYKIDRDIMAASASEYGSFGELIDFELFTAQAAAGLHTTIEDFTRFALASLHQHHDQKKNNTILSADIIEQMMKPVPASHGGYGLGYEILSHNILKGLRGHSGSNAGWQSMFMVDPMTNDGFIVFTNGGAGYTIINAVYCEWTALRKGQEMWENCDMQPSIANKLKQIIDEKGIEQITETYARIKKTQPEKYNYAENQLNNLGYFYLGRNEVEKAVALFKINVAAYPDAFNVYDSYGEALLKQGHKEEAIKNYIKSIELNPGNGNGINVLNTLGISSDDLIERFSMSIDAEVLNGYAGRYQTSTGEILKIEEHHGKLTVEKQGLRLDLVAQSTARFIAFGDGSIFSFFTAATGQKGLWAGDRIWRKLSDSPNGLSVQRATGNFLVFRNKSSWNRLTDFENVLPEIGCTYVQQESEAMANLDLSPYNVVIIPGFQDSAYYKNYIDNVARFNDYVAKGGILLLELNPGVNTSFVLPRGITMTPHSALENAIVATDHPIFLPLSGQRRIWARHASSGYFQNVPDDADILAIETNGTDALPDRPTFIEYPYGKGRVIAAFQCFHDRDGSGRGPMMESVISYALTRSRMVTE